MWPIKTGDKGTAGEAPPRFLSEGRDKARWVPVGQGATVGVAVWHAGGVIEAVEETARGTLLLLREM